jgi:hypothetical protein
MWVVMVGTPLRGVRGTARHVRTDGRLGETSLPTNSNRPRTIKVRRITSLPVRLRPA